MNDNLIRVKSFNGELKLSIKRGGLGYTVTTKEIVIQVPHQTYQVMHEDIISIVPYEVKPIRNGDETMIHESTRAASFYKIETKSSVVHNRSGIFNRGAMKYIVQLSNDFLGYVSKYSGLYMIETN